ncbi:MAG TPA: STAS domain-containing protein [Thermoanaerobaculia bacterium]|nr:STAS domain-containing protein [Thermoanaerobaculia bacterium]
MNAPSSPLTFAGAADGRLLTLVFVGRMTGDEVRKVRPEVDAAIEAGLPTLVDASGVSHMDSLGVALLVHVGKALEARRLPVAVIPGPGPVARLLGLARLDNYLNVAFSRSEALLFLGLAPGS